MGAKPVRWKLTELHFASGDIHMNIPKWIKSAPEKYIKAAVVEARNIHKKDLEEFSQGNKKKLQYFALQMYILKRIVTNLSEDLAKLKFEPFGIPWLLSNCRPAGGRWVPSSGFDHTPTGRECGMFICPWCWIRRYDKLRRVFREMGLTEPLNATVFDLGSAIFDKRDFRGQYMLYRSKIDKAVKRKLVRTTETIVRSREPEFPKALKIVGLVQEPGEPSTSHRLNVVYLHNADIEDCDRPITIETDTPTLQMTRVGQLTLHDALNRFQPYPAHMLNSPEWIKKTYEQLHGMRSYDTVHLVKGA